MRARRDAHGVSKDDRTLPAAEHSAEEGVVNGLVLGGGRVLTAEGSSQQTWWCCRGSRRLVVVVVDAAAEGAHNQERPCGHKQDGSYADHLAMVLMVR